MDPSGALSSQYCYVPVQSEPVIRTALGQQAKCCPLSVGGDVLSTCAEAGQDVSQRLDAHGARVCGDEKPARCHWCEPPAMQHMNDQQV